jgi:hypothetical protein
VEGKLIPYQRSNVFILKEVIGISCPPRNRIWRLIYGQYSKWFGDFSSMVLPYRKKRKLLKEEFS